MTVKTLAPCIICGGELDDESVGNNQPDGGLAFQCWGHWPSSIFDSGGRDGWLEINVCESCLLTATERGRVLNGDRPDKRSRATYKKWQSPSRLGSERLKMEMPHAIEILRDRLLTGWQPKAGEIDRDIRQIDALNWMWNFADLEMIAPIGITYQTADRERRKSKPVIHMDDHMTYALTADAFYWLYDAEESEKNRFLGG